jgi:hypothetical protein
LCTACCWLSFSCSGALLLRSPLSIFSITDFSCVAHISTVSSLEQTKISTLCFHLLFHLSAILKQNS